MKLSALQPFWKAMILCCWNVKSLKLPDVTLTHNCDTNNHNRRAKGQPRVWATKIFSDSDSAPQVENPSDSDSSKAAQSRLIFQRYKDPSAFSKPSVVWISFFTTDKIRTGSVAYSALAYLIAVFICTWACNYLIWTAAPPKATKRPQPSWSFAARQVASRKDEELHKLLNTPCICNENALASRTFLGLSHHLTMYPVNNPCQTAVQHRRNLLFAVCILEAPWNCLELTLPACSTICNELARCAVAASTLLWRSSWTVQVSLPAWV